MKTSTKILIGSAIGLLLVGVPLGIYLYKRKQKKKGVQMKLQTNGTSGVIDGLPPLFLGKKIEPKQKFYDTIAPYVIPACKKYGLFPSVTMVQIAFESGWGEHCMGKANNCCGIKATGSANEYWDGSYVIKGTREVINGKDTYPEEAFRAYPSVDYCIFDRCRLIGENERYEKAKQATTPELQIEEIHKAGYATAKDYATELKAQYKRDIKLISKYDEQMNEQV